MTDNAIRVSFSMLNNPPSRDRRVFVDVQMRSTMRRAAGFEAAVGSQRLSGVIFRPNGSGFYGYLPRLPQQNDALVLKSGETTFNTGVRFTPPNAPQTAALDDDEPVYDEEELASWGQDIDEAHAVRLNALGGPWLGWNAHRAAIERLVRHPAGGDERAFARAVGAWQRSQGMSEDGVLGPCTWTRMRSLVGAGVQTPCVTAVRFRNTGTVDADNCCRSCPPTGARAGRLPLGVGINSNGLGNTGLNGIEIRFTLSGHASGWEYDIQRTQRHSVHTRSGGVWTRHANDPMGTWDDNHNQDECLSPRGHHIFVIDTPGWNLVLPAAAPAGMTDRVLRASFAEWVVTRNRGSGVGWTRISLPMAWSTINWLRRNAAGRFELDRTVSRIRRGQIPAATIRADP